MRKLFECKRHAKRFRFVISGLFIFFSRLHTIWCSHIFDILLAACTEEEKKCDSSHCIEFLKSKRCTHTASVWLVICFRWRSHCFTRNFNTFIVATAIELHAAVRTIYYATRNKNRTTRGEIESRCC